ncbi:MAG TPA: biotin/lipoyl-binding protein [Niabella sp.]|jgi:biotin carboxyl carrier protein|nr:biotin/lipoyl-binding protein [Chitinophagaceae bacterium]HRN48364.1 biotin/lipoyl-binding protein [Niabella sp.]HRO84566.1 biotin/lipoyl-binding protein [Niabella sp.]HUN02614.1 biotin/lipoyl-binding protein [Niabella sp.]
MKTYKLKIKGKDYTVDVLDVEDFSATVKVNGVLYDVEIDQHLKTTKTPKLVRAMVSPSTDVEVSTAKTAKPDAVKSRTIKSPLPGKILDIFIKPGDKIKVGQTLLILEAMKMENNINADKEGMVKAINIQRNDAVMEGDVLIEIE